VFLNPRIWNRKLHRWAAIACLLPLLIVASTGILLQVKKSWSWVQPRETRGATGHPRIELGAVLEKCRAIHEAGVAGWADIERVDLRPDKGMLKVLTKSRWEVQLDATNGNVLQVAYRRADLIESLHDGSWFHAGARLWIFLPNGLLLLGLTLTGAYLWILPHFTQRISRKKSARAR
jgi:uncharacterized iron-regulated membrane protein